MLNPFHGGILFSIVPIIIAIGFIVVVGTIIVKAIQGTKQWNKNNHSPILTVEAKVTSKRSKVSSHNHHDTNQMYTNVHHYTYYFATFEVQSGDRMEFEIPEHEYGMLTEQDLGKLTFQGTRFKSFERNRI